MKLAQKVKRLDYFKRHIYDVLPYLTPRKVANILLNIIELKLKVTTPRSYPPFIKLEPTPLCHLRCPGCRHANENYNSELNANMKMSIDNVKHIVEPIADTLLGVSLSNHGEPLLNRDIAGLIRYLHERNIAVSFPTNLSIRMDEDAVEQLVTSGIDSLSVSLDGASSETYLKYRIGGRFDLVKMNVRQLHNAKRRLGLKRPRLIWKFVIFQHNKHEVEQVRSTYRNLGFDAYEMVLDFKDESRQADRRKQLQKFCFWPWHTIMIDWDGKVAPCCTHSDFELGNALENDISSLWTSTQYTSIREGLRDHRKIHPVCRGCLGIPPV